MMLHPRVLARWLDLDRDEIAISAISEAELRFGIAKRKNERLQKELDRFLEIHTVLEFSSDHVPEYARLRLHLERAGTPIGGMDMLIAAQAIALDLVLVTNNEREFRRVPGLKIENWAA
jgi:tRNA(fMet)-specific endonuclease VapC